MIKRGSIAGGSLLLVACASLPLAGRPLRAQMASISGRVIDGATGAGIRGATIVLTAGGAPIQRTVSTDSAGIFLLRHGPAEPPVLITVKRLGYHPRARVVSAQDVAAGEYVIIQLRAVPQAMQPVRVAARLPITVERRVPASSGSELESSVGNIWPVDIEDMGVWAQQQPGTAGRVGDGVNAVSVNGQNPSQTAFMVDGMPTLLPSQPREAVQTIALRKSAFDAALGRYSGGAVAASSRAGGSRWNTVAGVSAGSGRLTFAPAAGHAMSPTSLTSSLGLGGPIVRDRLYAYLAADARSATSRASTLETAPDAELQALGIRPAAMSAARAAIQQSGAPFASPASLPRENSGANVTLRLDSYLTERFYLTVRIHAAQSITRNSGVSPLASAVQATRLRREAGGLWSRLTRNTRFGSVVLAVGRELARNTADAPFGGLGGGAWISTGDSAGTSVPISFGQPVRPAAKALGAGTLSAEIWRGTAFSTHEVGGGVLWSQTAAHRSAVMPTGRYAFGSVEELARGEATSYERGPDRAAARLTSTDLAFFVRDAWRPNEQTALVYGVRAERGAVEYDGDGMRVAIAKTRAPWRVSPRVGVLLDSKNNQYSMRAGAGRFVGSPPVEVLASTLSAPIVASGIYCVGDDVSHVAPEWWTTPTDQFSPCQSSLGTSRIASTMNLASRYRAPETWHSSAEVRRTFKAGRHAIGIEGTWTRGEKQLLGVLPHLPAPRFAIPSESGRPVFVSPADIDPQSGRIQAQPLEAASTSILTSEGTNELWRLTLSGRSIFGGPHTTGIGFAFERLWSSAVTTGVPVPEGWLTGTVGSPNAKRRIHDILGPPMAVFVQVSTRWNRWIEASLLARTSSGVPYSPMVDADINGDGLANDGALTGVTRLLQDGPLRDALLALRDSATASVRSCVGRAMKYEARPPLCRSTPQSQFDFQLNVRRIVRGTTTISLRAQNVGAILDRLLHSAGNERGWGRSEFPDPILLRVTGFDPQTREFRYAVNGNFGGARVSRWAPSGALISLRARIVRGADPATERQRAYLASQVEDTRDRNALRRTLNALPLNIPIAILELAQVSSPRLSDAQLVRLQSVGDSVQVALDDALAHLIQTLERDHRDHRTGPSAEALSRSEAIVKIAQESHRQSRLALTADQWTELPARLRVPRWNVPTQMGVRLNANR